MSEQKVTINDCRAAGFCVKGVKAHCDTLGIDFRRLVREGLPFSELEKFDDHAVVKSIQKAKERTGVYNG